MVAGNAVPCSAYVYSVKGTDLVFYGTGWLSWESFTKEDDNKFVYGIKKIN
jgi:Na+-transporting NADH:ubiquinone oxidoreductase subunit NqrF